MSKRSFILWFLLLIATVTLFYACSKGDSLYNPDTEEPVFLYGRVCGGAVDSLCPMETFLLLPKGDTTIVGSVCHLWARTTPEAASLASVGWTIGADTYSGALLPWQPLVGGVYTPIVTITDHMGNTLTDTLEVHVNSLPSIDTIISPAQGEVGIHPTDPRGIRFSWTATDADTAEILTYSILLGADSTLLAPVVTGVTDTLYDLTTKLEKLKSYYWKLVVTDKYAMSDTSALHSFTTKDPDAIDGSVTGFAQFQGWNSHEGIEITIVAEGAIARVDTTDATGLFSFLNVTPKPNYTLNAKDLRKGEYLFKGCAPFAVSVGAISTIDTITLVDESNPTITALTPTGVSIVNRLTPIGATYSDVGSGVVPTSVTMTVDGVVIPDSLIQKVPGVGMVLSYVPARLSDGPHSVAISLVDSAGLPASASWPFTVDGFGLDVTTADSAVRINSPVVFSCYASNAFSAVASYGVDFNGDAVVDTVIPSVDSLFNFTHTFTTAGAHAPVFSVIDDKGVQKLDTIPVFVTNNEPLIDSLTPDTTISINDSVVFLVQAHDEDGQIMLYEWDVNGDGIYDFSGAALATIGYRFGVTPAVTKVGLRLTDDDNKVRLDSVMVTVVVDKPVPSVVGAGTIAVNAPLALTAQVTQQFGTITEYAWDNGLTPGWDVVDPAATSLNVTYTTQGGYTVGLKVTDDDGNVDSVFHSVTVTNDNPLISPKLTDKIISINDVVTFTTNATDAQGVKEYTWNFGDGTAPVVTTTGTVSHTFPATPNVCTVILTVTDLFDGVSYDTCVVLVEQDNPEPEISGASTIAVNAPLALTAKVTQMFGTISEYAWDNGIAVGWDVVGPNHTTFSPTYTVQGIYQVGLKVTDDDGNVDSVFHTVTVTNDNPLINPKLTDQAISINDAITFTTNATDAQGIKEYHWNFGDGSALVTTTTGTVSHTFPATPQECEVILTVTDLFDGVSYDTCMVSVKQDKPVPAIEGAGTIAVNAPLTLTAKVTQEFGTVVQYAWDNGLAPGWDVVDPTATSLNVTYTTQGVYTVGLKVTDDDGNVDSVYHSVTVTNDNPVISPKLVDQAISINDAITFTTNATDAQGIKEYHWNFGDGSSSVTTTTGTVSHTFPATSQECEVILTVTDLFDGVSYDTCMVSVKQDKPLVDAGIGRDMTIKDTYLLDATIKDTLGTIVSAEWSINGGAFLPVTPTNPDTSITLPDTENLNYLCVLKVTDDDNNVVMDTCAVKVHLDPPIVELIVPEKVRPNTHFYAKVGSMSPGNYGGSIVDIQWAWGSLDVFDISIGVVDTCGITSDREEMDNIPIVLKAIDDDGVAGYDTAWIDIKSYWEFVGGRRDYFVDRPKVGDGKEVLQVQLLKGWMGSSYSLSYRNTKTASVSLFSCDYDSNNPISYNFPFPDAVENYRPVFRTDKSGWGWVSAKRVTSGILVESYEGPYASPIGDTITVKNPNFSTTQLIAHQNGDGFISFVEDKKLYCFSLSSNNDWEPLIDTCVIRDLMPHSLKFRMKYAGNKLYMAGVTDKKETVIKKWDGIAWDTLSHSLSNNASSIGLSWDFEVDSTGVPYLARYEDDGTIKLYSGDPMTYKQSLPAHDMASIDIVITPSDPILIYKGGSFMEAVAATYNMSSNSFEHFPSVLDVVGEPEHGWDHAMTYVSGLWTSNGLYIAFRDESQPDKNISVIRYK